MSSTFWKPRTVVQAIEEAASSTQNGYRFVDETADAEPFFSHAGIERASARMGGALQSLGLKKGDRVALILPDNADFVFAFLGAVRAGIVPVPIYPPTGLGKLAGYLENTLHIVERAARRCSSPSPRSSACSGPSSQKAPELRRSSTSRRSAHARGAQAGQDRASTTSASSSSRAAPPRAEGRHAHPPQPRRQRALDHGPRASGPRRRRLGVSWLPLYHDMGLIGFVIAPLYHVNSITFLPPLLFLKRPAAGSSRSRAEGDHLLRAELRVRPVRQAHQGQRDGGLDLCRAGVSRAAAPSRSARRTSRRSPRSSRRRLLREGVRQLLRHGRVDAGHLVLRLGNRRQGRRVDGERCGPKGKAVVVDAEHAPRARRPSSSAGAVRGHEIAVFADDPTPRVRPRSASARSASCACAGPSMMRGYWNEPS
jgi:fatty-acyl-CoA synthase